MKDLPHFDLAELGTLAPDQLIQGERDDVGAFFLALALAFNDLKGVVWISQVMVDAQRAKERPAICAEVGQISGINIQVNRYSVGIIQEILVLIRDHLELLESEAFKAIEFNKVSAERWDTLVTLATSNKGDPFLKALAAARGNIAFHYQTRHIEKSFRAAFPADSTDPKRSRAYISVGENMEACRFYYADAVAIEALERSAQLAQFNDNFQARLGEVAMQVNEALAGVIGCFIASRGGATRLICSDPSSNTRGC